MLTLCASSPGDRRLEIAIRRLRAIDAAMLLARSDATTITVPHDASYGRAMTYRAVPLRALLARDGLRRDDVIQLIGADGFKTDLSARLVAAPGSGRAVPWLAIETPRKPWPRTPGGLATGPFYLVWTDPAASGILREQWPFAIVSIHRAVPSAARWPWLAPAPDVAMGSPVRRGQEVAGSQCMACHKVYGAGDAAIGLDLGWRRNPDETFSPAAFRAFVRRPPSSGRMPGFAPDVLSDSDLDAIYKWFGYLARRGGPRR